MKLAPKLSAIAFLCLLAIAPQVRDLLDSLYNGYPIGYLIAWQNPVLE